MWVKIRRLQRGFIGIRQNKKEEKERVPPEKKSTQTPYITIWSIVAYFLSVNGTFSKK